MKQPVIILARPQLGANIGACARAMRNFGLSELRLVSPRDGWPNAQAEATAAGASDILKNAKIYKDLNTATRDLHYSFATTARPRSISKTLYTPRSAAHKAYTCSTASQEIGFIFGCEANGLSAEEIDFSSALLSIPTHPDYASINISQAVLLVAYEFFLAGQTATIGETISYPEPAPQATIDNLVTQLIPMLEKSAFLGVPERKIRVLRNIRAMFMRGSFTKEEVSMLHGMLKALFEHKNNFNS